MINKQITSLKIEIPSSIDNPELRPIYDVKKGCWIYCLFIEYSNGDKEIYRLEQLT